MRKVNDRWPIVCHDEFHEVGKISDRHHLSLEPLLLLFTLNSHCLSQTHSDLISGRISTSLDLEGICSLPNSFPHFVLT